MSVLQLPICKHFILHDCKFLLYFSRCDEKLILGFGWGKGLVQFKSSDQMKSSRVHNGQVRLSFFVASGGSYEIINSILKSALLLMFIYIKLLQLNQPFPNRYNIYIVFDFLHHRIPSVQIHNDTQKLFNTINK